MSKRNFYILKKLGHRKLLFIHKTIRIFIDKNMKYNELKNKIEELKILENVDNFVLGKSTLGKDVLCFHIGDYGANQIIIEAGIHAREYISTLLVIEQIKYLKDKVSQGGIYFVPLVNPDGVELVLDGVDIVREQPIKDFLLQVNKSSDFSLWKANLKAIDLNVNFDAKWGEGIQNVRYLNRENFIGFYPNSETEVQNLIKLLYRVNPIGTISFHSKGEVIYYGFESLEQWQIIRDYMIAEKLSKINGYIPVQTENSTGGFSDFVSEKFGVPAFTIEVGKDSLIHPIGSEYLDEIVSQNLTIPTALLEILIEE